MHESGGQQQKMMKKTTKHNGFQIQKSDGYYLHNKNGKSATYLTSYTSAVMATS